MNELILKFLGGCGEVGANCAVLSTSTGNIAIDSGVHPKRHKDRMFPLFDLIENIDYTLITHAHNDHISSIPLLINKFPRTRIYGSRATRDIAEILVRDSYKLLSREDKSKFPFDFKVVYNPEIIERIYLLFEPIDYKVRQYFDETKSTNSFTMHPAGHVLGAGAYEIEADGKRILFTGDFSVAPQKFVSGAKFPTGHFDAVITEATNCASDEDLNPAHNEAKLADFINEVSNANGSVLIPSFSLGKTQEMLTIVNNLMRKGKIAHLPIYTAGMGRKISLIYDRFCYIENVVRQGFEISDIKQNSISREDIYSGDYFKESSIVIVSNGMFTKETYSYNLALEWLKRPGFGIAVVGYQDPETPGFNLQNSIRNRKFDFGGQSVTRKCKLTKLRFSAHSSKQQIVDYLCDISFNKLYIVHGDEEAIDSLALSIKELKPACKIFKPDLGISYSI